MNVNLIVSLIATVISGVFAGIVFRQYLARRRPYQLVWSLAILVFALGTFFQFLAELGGWTPFVYRAWYYTGAMAAAALLGQGTVYLQAPRKLADVTGTILAIIFLNGVVLVSATPVDLGKALTAQGVTGDGFPTTLLILLIPLNVYGTVTLCGGALWSFVHFWRSGKLGRRALGTFLIAVGGLTVAAGGTANRLGI
ncbi:MAG TPA: hypothetical protein VFZ25_02510, partial [Chloroflexota bacterium]|nr:hypothetical protein [Chloroflexota bacterium]